MIFAIYSPSAPRRCEFIRN